MKLLMITPRVDEDHHVLGFIPIWIRKLAERVDRLYVITLFYDVETRLPENATVYGINRAGIEELGKFIRFLSRLLYLNNTMLRTIAKVDAVFCHMSPRFTTWAAPYAKLFRKPIVTWYTHGHVSRGLRMAHFLCSRMVTASRESLRIQSNKIIITGHGIDTDRFKPEVDANSKKDKVTVLAVGRISPIKDYETLVRAADILINKKGMKNLEFLIVGGVPMTSQEEYYERLKKIVGELELQNYVRFVGSVPYGDVASYYQRCDIVVHPSHASALEKVVLEAMACGKPVITSNIGYYEDVFDEEMKEKCYFEKSDHRELAGRIECLLNDDVSDLRKKLRSIVVTNHSVSHLADSLVNVLKDVAKCT